MPKMENTWLLLLLHTLLLSLLAPNTAEILSGDVASIAPSTSSISRSEYIALQAWKSAITDDPFGITSSWVGFDVCSYKGVYCFENKDFMGNPISRTVASIDLNHANLQGTLVKELAFLTDLSVLHLNSNRFTGDIPLSFQLLPSLAELDLSNNNFSGPFPMPALYIPNLVYLDLRYNQFCGPIPQALFDKQLDAIFLNNNLFDGEIPPNLGSSPASAINLANNRFSGPIPLSPGYMAVREILLLNNKLTGCIPEGVSMWSDLEVLDVSSNYLMGHLPNSLSCLHGLEVLNLANNELSGELPDLVCSLQNLLNLTVAANFFSGYSPDCNRLFFRNCGFDYAMNCIPGRQMQRPQPECATVPGGGLNCPGIPPLKALGGGGFSKSKSAATSIP